MTLPAVGFYYPVAFATDVDYPWLHVKQTNNSSSSFSFDFSGYYNSWPYDDGSTSQSIEISTTATFNSTKKCFDFTYSPWYGSISVNGSSLTLSITNNNGISYGRELTLGTPLTKIVLSPSSKTISVNDSFTPSLTYTPSNATYPAVMWFSSNDKVAAVDLSTGKVTGISPGTATIYAKAMDGSGVQGSCTVTVDAVVEPVYRALLIGNQTFLSWNNDEKKYYIKVDDAHYNDAKLLGNMLHHVKGAQATDGTFVTIDVEPDLDYDGILNAIKTDFAGTTDNDISLFYLITHGNSGPYYDHGAWRPGNGDLTMPYKKSQVTNALADAYYNDPKHVLSLKTLANWLNTYVKGRVIVIIGSCGSGAGIFNTYYEQNSSSASSQTGYTAAFVKRAVNAFAAIDSGVDIIEPNFGEFRKPNKFYVLTSARAGETAWFKVGGYSYFEKTLAQGVGSSGNMPADDNRDGVVDLEELFTYISQRMPDTEGKNFGDQWYWKLVPNDYNNTQGWKEKTDEYGQRWIYISDAWNDLYESLGYGQDSWEQHVQRWPVNSHFALFK